MQCLVLGCSSTHTSCPSVLSSESEMELSLQVVARARFVRREILPCGPHEYHLDSVGKLRSHCEDGNGVDLHWCSDAFPVRAWERSG